MNEKDKVSLIYDHDAVGIVIRLGPEVSEVKFTNGTTRFIRNLELITEQEDTTMPSEQVVKFNQLAMQATTLGLLVDPIKKFSDRATGEKRIKALEAKLAATKVPRGVVAEKKVVDGITGEFGQRSGSNRELALRALEKRLGAQVDNEVLTKAIYGETQSLSAMHNVIKGLIEACPKTYEIKKERGSYGLYKK